ncbi:MAG: hypothetical protein ABIH42_01615, partial [Planctomycetota bacterium]
ILHKVLSREIIQREAAKILSLSYRQTKRIVKKVKLEGDAGIAHKSRERPSNRRLPVEIRNKAIALYRKKYNDFGPTLASEKLAQLHRMRISVETLRSWLIRWGLGSKTQEEGAPTSPPAAPIPQTQQPMDPSLL